MCLNLEKMSPFSRMVLGALLGITLGIIFGFFFGVIIAFLARAAGNLGGPGMGGDDFIPYEVASFLGMGIGSIIGAVMGSTSANKK